MSFFHSGHEMNQVIIESFSFLNELSRFPNENFGNEVSNGLGLNMIAHDLDIVFGRFENEVKELNLKRKVRLLVFS